MNKKDVLKNIHDLDLKLEVSKIIDFAILAQNKTITSTTHFLAPVTISTAMHIIEKIDITIGVYGGAKGCERCVMLIAPPDKKILKTDFNIDVLEINYNGKFSKNLAHGDFLGSVLGIGLKREMVGDIIVEQGGAKIFVHNTISDYILMNLERVGHTKVNVARFSQKIELDEDAYIEILKTSVNSLRVDVILCKIFHVSRGELKKNIDSGKVFINWLSVSDGSKLVKNGDIISLRGWGRIKFLECAGISKKEHIYINYLKY